MSHKELGEPVASLGFPRHTLISLLVFAVSWEVLSNLAPYLGIPPFAVPSLVRIAKAIGTITPIDVVVTLAPEAHHRALELTRTEAVEVEYWPTFDASLMIGQGNRDQVLESYRGVRDGLFARIKERFALTGGPSV